MLRVVILCAIVLAMNVHAAAYASSTSWEESYTTSAVSAERDLTALQQDQSKHVLVQYAANTETTYSAPALRERRSKVQDATRRLITFSEKASADIRSEVKKIKAQRGSRVSEADIKRALEMANKFDNFARQLKQKQKTMSGNDQDFDSTYQTVTDMSQQLQLELQEEMNKVQQAMQVMSNIMKNQHDTLMSIIRNLK